MKPSLFLVLLSWFVFVACDKSVDPVQIPLFVRCLDVGVGDAVLITLPGGKNIMVDVGGSGCGSDTLLKKAGITRLDEIILTHAHEDHTGNLRSVLAVAPASRVILGLPRSAQDSALHRCVADSSGLDTLRICAGQSLSQDERVELRCIWPDTNAIGNPDEAPINAQSLVFEIRYGESAVLLTGDAGFSMEQSLLVRQKLRPVTALKAGHHGSATATSAAFLACLSPLITLVSTGANPYGHPTPETLERIKASGSALYRTDINGTTALWLFENGDIRMVTEK